MNKSRALFMIMTKEALTEFEKIEIITHVKSHGNEWTRIGQNIGRPASTVKSFYKSYLEHGTINPTRGRPAIITNEIKDAVVGFMNADPLQNLQVVANEFDIAKSSVKSILNENKISYYKRTPISPLTEFHKNRRLNICRQITSVSPQNLLPIIFTDESTVYMDLEGGGIWRERGFYPPQSFFEKEQGPLHLMIWGGIGPNGFRTPLLYFDGHVNSATYIKALKENFIFENIESIFGRRYIWQQDGASPHRSSETLQFLNTKIPIIFDWPAYSPDLSPIEQVWGYMKKKISGKKYQNEKELYENLSQIWNDIPNETLNNYTSSFWARCKVCEKYNGDSLNGRWSEVKELHNSYR